MKLLACIGWGIIIVPIAIILAKLIGWISWSWLVTVFIAISIPLSVSLGFLALAVWIIRREFTEEWNQ